MTVQGVIKTCGEFSSERNIFEVEAENDKQEGADIEEYQLPIRVIETLRLGGDE